MLQVRELRMVYDTSEGGVQAVRGVSFEVNEGEFYTLLGPSGCGKTTTLRCIAGLETPTGGEIVIGDHKVFSGSQNSAVPAHKRNIGMVFQSYAIWPHLTVYENVAFPLSHGSHRAPRSSVRGRVMRALETVQLAHLADRPAPLLSGGQQQRVALARALVHEPALLLLDEPLSNLDAKLREEMRHELKELVNRLSITTVYVTHDQVEALSMSDRLAVMYEGVIMQEGLPRDVYLHPINAFTANFLGRTNVVEGVVRHAGDATTFGTVETSIGSFVCSPPAWAEKGSSVLLAFRPEGVLLGREPIGDGPNGLVCVIRGASFIGDVVEYQVEVGGRFLRAKGDPFDTYQPGDPVYAQIPPDRCLVIAPATATQMAGTFEGAETR